MSNLGRYLLLTRPAKFVGGPVALAAGLAVGGYLTLRPVEAGVKRAVRTVKTRVRAFRLEAQADPVAFTMQTAFTFDGGLTLAAGDKGVVLVRDGDVVLVGLDDLEGSGHYVSAEELAAVSNFEL